MKFQHARSLQIAIQLGGVVDRPLEAVIRVKGCDELVDRFHPRRQGGVGLLRSASCCTRTGTAFSSITSS